MSLDTFVGQKIDDAVDKKFPHIKLPCAMYARITGAAKQGENYVYSIKLLRDDLGYNTEYPEIPGVKSKMEIEVGKYAAVLLMYGDMKPHIIGVAIP